VCVFYLLDPGIRGYQLGKVFFFLVLLGDDICSMCVTSVSDSLLGSQVQPSLNIYIYLGY